MHKSSQNGLSNGPHTFLKSHSVSNLLVFPGGQRNRNRKCLSQRLWWFIRQITENTLKNSNQIEKERLQCMGRNKSTESQHDKKQRFWDDWSGAQGETNNNNCSIWWIIYACTRISNNASLHAIFPATWVFLLAQSEKRGRSRFVQLNSIYGICKWIRTRVGFYEDMKVHLL